MVVQYVGQNPEGGIREQIWNILCQCDDEFYPPLSARVSSSQKVLKTADGETPRKRGGLPTEYFDEMIRQYFIIASENGSVAGFMTFRKDYCCEALERFGESLYITTVCVARNRRRQGVLALLYGFMERRVTQICSCNKISTRTWSRNDAQLHTLEKRGYRVLSILPNDRGKGIDTVYYGIEIKTP